MDRIKDIYMDIKDAIINFFSEKLNIELGRGGGSFFSVDNIENFIQTKGSLLILMILVILGGGMFAIYGEYVDLKYEKMNTVVLKENKIILEKIKKKKIAKQKEYESVNKNIESQKKYDLGKMVCFFYDFDKKSVDYVNREFKIKNINFNKDKQTFDVTLQGIKHYRNLISILVLLKQYKTIVDLDSYEISLENEKVGLGDVTYYVVNMKGSIYTQDFKHDDIIEEKDKKK